MSYSYSGYLRPWMQDISRMWDEGLTTFEIATVINRDIQLHPEKLQDWPSHWGRPSPSSTMVRYVLERIRPDNIDSARPAAGTYPTEQRWTALIPRPMAKAQARWERRRMVHNMHAAGVAPTDIARRFGISRSRVWQLLQRAPTARSPFERYLSEDKADLKVLASSHRLRLWAEHRRSDLQIYIDTEITQHTCLTEHTCLTG